ncbi:MAG: putative lipoprotein YmbA [Halioglobus sp.]|jgi:uncharacterized lipoprotein YmbA
MIRITTLLWIVLLCGCAGQSIEPNYYLLRSDQDPDTRKLQVMPDIALGTVSVAPYLDQPGLVLETKEGELRSANYHLWAEPLYEGARLFMLTELSRELGQDIVPWDLKKDASRLDIRIDQFHGTASGDVTLVAYWWLHDGDKTSGSYQFAEKQPLDADGYPAMAQAQKQLLEALAEKIAETLVEPD